MEIEKNIEQTRLPIITPIFDEEGRRMEIIVDENGNRTETTFDKDGKKTSVIA